MAITTSSGDGYCLYNGAKVLASEVPEGAESIALDGMTVIEWDGDTTDLTVAGTMALISEKTPDTGKTAAYSTVQTDGTVYLSGEQEGATDSGDGYYYWGTSLIFRYYPSASGTVTTPGIYANTPTSGVELSEWLFAFYEAGSTDSGSESTAQQGAVSRAAMVATADAIRTKLGTTDQIQWEAEKGFAGAISGLTMVIQVASADDLPDATTVPDGTVAIITGG